ncbi:DUF4145 domain-containing protein [Microvirga sp. 2YAF29]|uniref:DUF4145 domain-containing protein n=1 Tax=Microvirga sp. 2YAF29 TaxID=3233031 RepID=UPI003F9C7838
MTDVTSGPQQPSIIRAHCNRCGGLRKHDVLFAHDVKEDLEDAGWFLDRYFFIRCGGCDYIHLRHDFYSNHTFDDNGVPQPSTTYYPPAEARRRPEWMTARDTVFWAFTSDIGQLLSEIYRALENDSLRLAAMGTRALLEIIMIDQNGDHGSIGKNIDAFFASGHIAPKQQDIFRSFMIEAGHAAMHRAYKPDEATLSVLLDLLEGLIASIYIYPYRTKNMAANIPPRQISSKPSVES